VQRLYEQDRELQLRCLCVAAQAQYLWLCPIGRLGVAFQVAAQGLHMAEFAGHLALWLLD